MRWGRSRYDKTNLLHVPVIHAGNKALVECHTDADELLIMGRNFAKLCPELGRDELALTPNNIVRYFRQIFSLPIRIVRLSELPKALWANQLVLANEAISRVLVQLFALNSHHQLLIEPTFLFHNRPWSRPGPPDNSKIARTANERHRRFLNLATAQSQLSSDWWRRVGAVAVRGNDILLEAYNHHLPSEYSPYINGDPRDNFSRGVHPELSTAIHAEAALVSEAAKIGLSLCGASLYVTTSPCPPCAQIIAAAGFSHCHYAGSYATANGEKILRRAHVKLVWVNTTNPSS